MNPSRRLGHCARLDSIRCDSPQESAEAVLDCEVARLNQDLGGCPYCGAANEGPPRSFPLGICQVHRRGARQWRVVCDNCRAEGPPGDDPAEGAAAWNERTRGTVRTLHAGGDSRLTLQF